MEFLICTNTMGLEEVVVGVGGGWEGLISLQAGSECVEALEWVAGKEWRVPETKRC